MAKNWKINSGMVNPEGYDAAVLQPVTPSGTLGQIVAGILAAAAVTMVCTVDFKNRVVHARPTNGDDTVETLTAEGTDLASVAALKQLTEGKTSVWIDAEQEASQVTIAGAAGPLEKVVARPSLVARSISSLISAVEDDLASEEPLVEGGEAYLLVVDQETERVTLIAGSNVDVEAALALFGVGETLADTARYEQEAPEDDATAPKLAFE